MKRILLAALFALVWAAPHVVHAQNANTGAYTVSTCGTPPNGFGISGSGYSAGAWYPVLQDTTGKLCTSSSGGGSAPPANGATGSAVPAQADYEGLNNGGTLIGAIGDSSGREIEVGAGTAGSPAGGILTIQGVTSMTKLLVTPDSVALPANQSVNENQIGGIAVSLGNGVTDTGTQKVTISSDSTGQVKLATGANTIGALTANQSVNTAQINGVTVLTGTGAQGTGSERVTVATDTATIAGSAVGTAGTASANVVTVQGVASMTKLLVTPDSVALPANQSVNVSQINAVTPLMGNGVTGAGSQRVTISSDNTAFAVNPAPTASNGVSTFSKLVANNTTSVAVDAAAGNALSIRAFNNSNTIAYLKLYNASQGSTTCGSGTPILRELIPANTSGAGVAFELGGGYGVNFSTAITACVTTGIADADTTAPAASAYIYEIDFK